MDAFVGPTDGLCRHINETLAFDQTANLKHFTCSMYMYHGCMSFMLSHASSHAHSVTWVTKHLRHTASGRGGSCVMLRTVAIGSVQMHWDMSPCHACKAM